MNTVDKVKSLCKTRKIPISRLERDLGFSNGYIGQLKKGTFPNARLVAISDYLKIPIDELLGDENSGQLTSKDERDIAKDMEQLRSKLMSGENGPLSFDGEPVSNEDVELLLGQIELMMHRLKPINKEKYNPNKNKK